MASSLISNSHHIDFESVFGLDDAGMVQMFETLITTGLKEFLGCPAVFYEAALTEFFANSSVREDGMVFSTIGGTAIEISQEMFAAAFELPTEGLIDLTDVPKNFVFDARSLFSDSKEQAGSFDSVTRDRFLLMTAITFDVKINWSSLLFGVFKEMVTPGSRQAKGYAIQICVLLRNVLGLELGESKAFPIQRILNEKTVHRFVSVNENVGINEVADAPRAKKTPVKKTVSKKRPAAGDAEVAPVIKKKRTTKGKSVAVKKLLVEDPVATIPSSGQLVAEIATGDQEPVAEVAPGDADAAIEQVLAQLDLVFKHQDADRSEKVETWFDKAFDEAFDEEFEIANKERQNSEEEIDVDVAAGISTRSLRSKQVAEELMPIDDLLLQISADLMLSSITAVEISKLRLGESIVLHDKGKGVLVEDEPVNGNPARETVELICGDVEVLVQLRARVMKDVVDFFHSFSLNKLPDPDALKELKEKEKLMLEWAETESLEMAVKRTEYILAKYRESLEDLLVQQKEHGQAMERPCSSTLFAGSMMTVEAAPSLTKTWEWQRVCTEVILFSVSGCLRPASCFTDIVVANLGVERLPDYFLEDFDQGVHTEYFVDFLSVSSVQSDSEIDSASTSGNTVYRSPSPTDNPFALGPAIFSSVAQEERLYFVQSPESPPAASPHQESSSSSTDVSMHFDSADIPVHAQADTQTSAPIDFTMFTDALEDLRSSIFQRIHDSNCEILHKVKAVEFDVREALLQQQVLLLGTIFQDLMDIKRNQREHDAKLTALDGQIAAIRNEQLDFQTKIAADILSLSTQISDIADFIRSGDAKKGEVGSSSRRPPIRVERRPLPTPQASVDDQSGRDIAGSSGAVHITGGGTFAERVERARRQFIESGLVISVEEATERVIEADRRESDRLERERARERREKRLSRSSASKRRRGF
ncbi:hypothetical protein F511_19282 [Dorcoceras hygrometricum]|uniref:Dystroglycan-like n=1 Tax=Dorcoceras hygrometricum TaxID=472368 RepID=A0A2Z7A7L0_9LAMI|nr:hypothetical protein F511_19282 [Dorcoceras hygrometricum]